MGVLPYSTANLAAQVKKRWNKGLVVSDKMDKSVAVLVERWSEAWDGKRDKLHTKFICHDENECCKEGDIVYIADSVRAHLLLALYFGGGCRAVLSRCGAVVLSPPRSARSARPSTKSFRSASLLPQYPPADSSFISRR